MKRRWQGDPSQQWCDASNTDLVPSAIGWSLMSGDVTLNWFHDVLVGGMQRVHHDMLAIHPFSATYPDPGQVFCLMIPRHSQARQGCIIPLLYIESGRRFDQMQSYLSLWISELLPMSLTMRDEGWKMNCKSTGNRIIPLHDSQVRQICYWCIGKEKFSSVYLAYFP